MATNSSVDIEMPEAAGSSHVNIEHALAGVEVRFVVLREMQAHQVVAIGHRNWYRNSGPPAVS